MMHRKTRWMAGIAAGALAAGCGPAQQDPGLRPPEQSPGGLAALTAAAPRVAVGRVTDITPGRTVEGPEPTRFENVLVTVEQTLKGDAATTVTLEQLAGVTPASPAMRRGERYLLFVRPRRDGPGWVVLPQGRVLLASGRARSMSPGPVATEVDGLDEAELLARVRAAAGN